MCPFLLHGRDAWEESKHKGFSILDSETMIGEGARLDKVLTRGCFHLEDYQRIGHAETTESVSTCPLGNPLNGIKKMVNLTPSDHAGLYVTFSN